MDTLINRNTYNSSETRDCAILLCLAVLEEDFLCAPEVHKAQFDLLNKQLMTTLTVVFIQRTEKTTYGLALLSL